MIGTDISENTPVWTWPVFPAEVITLALGCMSQICRERPNYAPLTLDRYAIMLSLSDLYLGNAQQGK